MWRDELKKKIKLQNTYFILKINKMYNHNANFTHCCQVCLSLWKKKREKNPHDLYETYQQNLT